MHSIKPIIPLLLGDAFTLLVVALAGFANHNQAISIMRFLAVYLPLLASWALLAPWFQVYHPQVPTAPRRIWQPVLAAVLAAPLAAVLRGFWLDQLVVPLFALVIGLSAALGIGLWRLIWVFVLQAKAPAWMKQP